MDGRHTPARSAGIVVVQVKTRLYWSARDCIWLLTLSQCDLCDCDHHRLSAITRRFRDFFVGCDRVQVEATGAAGFTVNSHPFTFHKCPPRSWEMAFLASLNSGHLVCLIYSS